MKRHQVFFCLTVFGILFLGYYREQRRRLHPSENFYVPNVAPPVLEPLVMPGGMHRLAGVVRDSNSRIAPGVQVFLYRTQALEQGAEPLLWALSDEEGRYRIDGLEAVEYGIVLYRPGVPLDAVRGRVTPPLAQELTLYLAPALPPIETLPGIERFPLLGRVGLPAGRTLLDTPLEDYSLVARPLTGLDEMTGAVTRHATSDAQGFFGFENLVEGPYRIELMPPWAAGGTWPVVGEVEILHGLGAPPIDVILPLSAGSVAGVVRDLNERAIPGAMVRLWPIDAPERVWPAETTNAEGRVHIPNLPAGRYVVRVRAGGAASELVVDVQAGITRGLAFDALDPRRSSRP